MTVISNSIEVKPTVGQIAMKGLPAVIIAVGINVVLFFIGSVFNAFPDDVLTPMGAPIQLVPVAGMTLFGGIAATVGYFVLTRYLSIRVSKVILGVVGVLVLIGMFFMPLDLRSEGLPIFGVVLLEVMHFVAGLLPLGRLIR